MKKYRVTNMSDNNIALPSELRHLIPVLEARKDAILEVNDAELSMLRRLAPLGVILTSAEVGLLGGSNETLLKDEVEKFRKELKEKEKLVGTLSAENVSLKEQLEEKTKSLETLSEEYENFKVQHDEIVKKYKAKLKEAKS